VSEKRFESDVVLLGASNLTRALPLSVTTASRAVGPARFWIACGHGRSYGLDSSVLARTLPGIVSCGLWDDLAKARSNSLHVFITDVGNDILYGQAPKQILAWVRTCVERLSPASVTMSGLPMARLAKLSRPAFAVIARAIFPGHRLTYDLMQSRVAELQESLAVFAADSSIAWTDQPAHWYGWDPIHIRRRFHAEAYATMLSGWGMSVDAVRPSRRFKRLISRTRPQSWHVLGKLKRCEQPCATLGDGSIIHRY
jgi:hypothetical protein